MISVSEGEIIDRLTILEIKQKEIHQEERLQLIKKEIELYKQYDDIKKGFELYFKLMFFINKRIWDLTNQMKEIEYTHPNYALISFMIFDYNQQRFRIKNIINTVATSSIKEQKSYATHTGYINVSIENIDTIYDIVYSLLHYDNVEIYYHPDISTSFKHRIQTIFPTIQMINQENLSTPSHHNGKDQEKEQLINYLEKECKEYLNPIVYIAGGKQGDFILQLSVVHQQYLKTGRKGIIYMYDDIPDLKIKPIFTNGLQDTYDDIYSLLKKQNYILDCKIWSNEPYDINLSKWYNSPLLYQRNWHDIFEAEYDIDWGKDKWLETEKKAEYANLIVIAPIIRKINVNLLDVINQYVRSNMIFVCFHRKQYNEFVENYGIELPFVECKTIEEMAIIINSCELFIGGMSSPLTLAQAVHAKTTVFLDHDGDSTHNLLENNLPNYNVLL